MDDLLVHRGADRRRIAVVPLERRFRARLMHEPLGQLIEIPRRDAGRHCLSQLGENSRHELVHASQFGNLALRTADDHRARSALIADCAASSIIVSSSSATRSGAWAPFTTRNVGRSR